MRVLLFGKTGQLGSELQRTLLAFGELRALGRAEVDLTHPTSVEAAVADWKPDLIVNASAYTAVDRAEAEVASAFAVNCESVRVLADYCQSTGAHLVHYSTDYVFDGTKDGLYVESDTCAPLSVYGRSKRAGEEAILESGCEALIFRTSWVFGVQGTNFLKTILKLARERERLDVVSDQWGAPTSAELLADVTALSILAWRLGRLSPGLYHLTAGGAINWHGLACYALEFAAAKGWPLKIYADQVGSIPTEQYPRPAQRPLNSRLSLRKLEEALGIELPDWRVHVSRFLSDSRIASLFSNGEIV